MPDEAAEDDPHSPDYDLEHTYGVYHLQNEDLTKSPENRTYIEESRVTPNGWTADSKGTHIQRAHLDCEEVTIEELKFEFQGHHTVILRPENVPGEVEHRSPMTTAADLGYQFAVRPDERDKLDDVKAAEAVGENITLETNSAADAAATDESSVNEDVE